jgi:histidinol-phosphate aminotransferase
VSGRRSLVLGIGCSSYVRPDEALAAVSAVVVECELPAREIDLVATVDRLREHPALVGLAAGLEVPLVTYRPAELDAILVPTPSAYVRDQVGTRSVAEAAALLAAAGGRLLVPKQRRGGVTIAVAETGWSTRLRPRPPAVHGGASALPIDLSASMNPLGPSPRALQAAAAVRLDRYPEPDAAALRSSAAAVHGVPAGMVVPVPGSGFGLWLAMTTLLTHDDGVVGLWPCFGEYPRSAAIAGAAFTEARLPLAEPWGEEAIGAALAGEPALCVLANPGNPTGARIPAERLRRACAAHPGTRFLVDEAFAAFAPPGTSLLEDGPLPANVLVVRSLTKELALPGLRMGYLVGPPALAAALAGALPAWPLSAPSVAAAVAGIDDVEHVRAGADLARRHLAMVAAELRDRGLDPLPTDANYLLCPAPGLASHLALNGVCVRDCASFGLPGSVRIAAPRVPELAAVLSAIGSFVPP